MSGLIDACVYHHWGSQSEVTDHLPAGWREFLRQPARLGVGIDEMDVMTLFPYHRADGDELLDEHGELVAPTLDRLREQVFERDGADRAVLMHRHAMFAPSMPNPHLARVFVRAVNDWSLERWLEPEPRLHGLALVSNQTPEDAIAELERLAPHPQIAGVLMAANPMSKPFGHPVYHPIYRTAEEHDLPIVFHTGGDATPEARTAHAGGGPVSTYAEFATLAPQAFMTHLVSMIAQGVFVRFPNLRVLVTGTGAAWLPAIFWRFDIEYNAYRRETPWVTERPSDTLRRQIRLTSFPLDVAPRPEQVRRLLGAFPGMEDILVYASGWPSWNTDTPEGVRERIPEDWHPKVFHDNARQLFRWNAAAPRRAPAGAPVGEMEDVRR